MTDPNNATLPPSQRAKVYAAEALGRKDWADATDYRNTGAQDREAERMLGIFQRFESDILQPSEPVAVTEEMNACLHEAMLASMDVPPVAAGSDAELAADIRNYVEILANQPLGVSMTEWNIISNAFLRAATRLQQLTQQEPAGDVVEIVAKALCAASSEEWRDGTGYVNAEGINGLNNHWRHKARAAIAAMRGRSV